MFADKKKFFNFLINEAEHPISGWNFSYIRDRIVNDPLPWSYTSILIPLIRKSTSLLDMGTGGGDFLSSLIPLPKKTRATEAYAPSLSTAKKNLEPLGVEVYFLTDERKLPFDNDEFEVIINRHEFYDPDEVFRILKKGGLFITQQIGDRNDKKLRLILTGSEHLEGDTEWNLNYAIQELIKKGFHIIEKNEIVNNTRIFDVGAIVYYLKIISWDIPDFTVQKYFDKLWEIHKQIVKKNYMELKNNNHRFLIIAEKS
jgi:SAM-dependent methyltransferase